MLVHMAKHHKDDLHRPRNQNSTFDKARDAKDGLHICRHCNKTQCDWSRLRKHIQERRCPVLFTIPVREAGAAQPSLGASVAPSEAQVESEALQEVPYPQRPRVVSAVGRHGDNVAFHLPDRHVLTHHCALCNQWITVPGKMKQPYRLSHSDTHEAFAHPAAKPCSRFNTSASPCEHCGGSIPLNALYSGSYVSCISGTMDVDTQELLQKYGDAVLKEEPGEDTTTKAPKLEGGKGNGRPHNEASRHTQPRRSTAERQSPCTGPFLGGEGIGQIGTSTRDLHQGAETGHHVRGSSFCNLLPCAHSHSCSRWVNSGSRISNGEPWIG